jgi:hypothetical protein
VLEVKRLLCERIRSFVVKESRGRQREKRRIIIIIIDERRIFLGSIGRCCRRLAL